MELRWLASRLFRSYLRRFLLLWVAGKIANAATAAVIRLPPLAFRPATEWYHAWPGVS